MLTQWKRDKRKKIARSREIAPDEIFLDSSNLSSFDEHQFEGRLEKPIGKKTIVGLVVVLLFIGLLFTTQLWRLQIQKGEVFALQAQENRLDRHLMFPRRGIILDRIGTELAWNVQEKEEEEEFLRRDYSALSGFSHVLGYVSYPKVDRSGFYYQEDIQGVSGVESFYNDLLSGKKGAKIVETDVHGAVLSESVVEKPHNGENLMLTLDARVQERLHAIIADRVRTAGFVAGAGVLMDARSGEILALTSFPEFDSQLLTDGTDRNTIQQLIESPSKPFLNRAVSGAYTPGSIVKPFVAVGALEERVIDPRKQIFSSGSITIPNPYNPELESVFNDWKAHGFVDLRRALAVSSNVYFYEVGGGFEDQRGIGIAGIEKYVKKFGIGGSTDIDLAGEVRGTIPTPAWKEKHFPGDPWRVGDTYNTSIGQYGFQVTPIQMVRAAAAVANGGLLVTPHLVLSTQPLPGERVDVSPETLQIVREGMRQAVTSGIASRLNFSFVKPATKTGTAEVGITKGNVNSWIIGFFPFDEPRYAFSIVLEKGPSQNQTGALHVMRELFEWMHIYTPEYLP